MFPHQIRLTIPIVNIVMMVLKNNKSNMITSSELEERFQFQCQIILDGYQKYYNWWLPIDVANGSTLAPMTFLWFCEYLLVFDDKKWFDRWLDKDKFILPKGGGEKTARVYMKKFILEQISKHHMGYINLYDKENPFKEIENVEKK